MAFAKSFRKVVSNVSGLNPKGSVCKLGVIEDKFRNSACFKITEEEVKFLCLKIEDENQRRKSVERYHKYYAAIPAWLAGITAGWPVFFNMLSLVFGAMADLSGLENATFMEAIEYFNQQSPGMIGLLYSVSVGLTIGAIIGQGPFNVVYMKNLVDKWYRELAAGKFIVAKDYNTFWNIVGTIDNTVGNLLGIIGSTLPLAFFLDTAWKSMFPVLYASKWCRNIFTQPTIFLAATASGASINNGVGLMLSDVVEGAVDTLCQTKGLIIDYCAFPPNNPKYFTTAFTKNKNAGVSFYACREQDASVRNKRKNLLHWITYLQDVVRLSPTYATNEMFAGSSIDFDSNQITVENMSAEQTANLLRAINKTDFLWVKRIFANLIFLGGSIYLVIQGTPQFTFCGSQFADEFQTEWLGMEAPYNGVSTALGLFSRIMFVLLWVCGVQDLGRWMMRQLPNKWGNFVNLQHWQKLFASKFAGGCSYNIKYYSALLFAVYGAICLALTNIAIMPKIVLDKVLCAILSNLAVSLMGTMNGLMWMPKWCLLKLPVDKMTKLSGFLNALGDKIETMNDYEVNNLWKNLIKKDLVRWDFNSDDNDFNNHKDDCYYQNTIIKIVKKGSGYEKQKKRQDEESDNFKDLSKDLSKVDHVGEKIDMYDYDAVEGVHYGICSWDKNDSDPERVPLKNGRPYDVDSGCYFDDPKVFDQKTGLVNAAEEDDDDYPGSRIKQDFRQSEQKSEFKKPCVMFANSQKLRFLENIVLPAEQVKSNIP